MLRFNAHVFLDLGVVVGLILLDWLLGALGAAKGGTFDWHKLHQSLVTNIFPVIGGLIVLAVIQSLADASGLGTAGVLAGIGFYGYSAAYLPHVVLDITGKLTALLGTSPTAVVAPPVVPHG